MNIIDFATKHKSSLATWGGFFVVSTILYFAVNGVDFYFSFLLTYAAFLRCFGFALLNLKVYTTKTVRGISAKTLEAYGLVFVFRLLSIVRHDGYLPYDKSGDWFYHAVEILSLAMVALAYFALRHKFKVSYDKDADAFGNLHLPSEFGVVYVVVPCLLLAFLLHPKLNNEFFSDFCWTFSMYLECVSCLPQLYMFQRQKVVVVETLLSHFVAAVGIARVVEMVFWSSAMNDLSQVASHSFVGYFVLITQIAHLVLMADFYYYYFKSIRAGGPMTLPTHQPSGGAGGAGGFLGV